MENYQIGPVDLLLNEGADAAWYKQRKAHEEAASRLYPLISAAVFTYFLDVGSNYGFIGILAARQGLSVACVEADPRLISFIESNFERNGLKPLAVLNAIAGREADGHRQFSLNPKTTLDNRVVMPGWSSVPVPKVRLDDVIAGNGLDRGRLFIKIDTQGFEEHVLDGLQGFLSSRADWTIKMEFAPDWLRSQGSDPLGLLNFLVARFEAAEFPDRIPFNTPALDSLFDHALREEQTAAFLEYVMSLNSRGLGWVDLLVRPRQKPRRCNGAS